MNRGATIQFAMRLNTSWIANSLSCNVRCILPYCTLHKIGYIIASSPIAADRLGRLHLVLPELTRLTNRNRDAHKLPFWSAGLVSGTKFPRMIPIAIARKIQTARKRSRIPSCGMQISACLFSGCQRLLHPRRYWACELQASLGPGEDFDRPLLALERIMSLPNIF